MQVQDLAASVEMERGLPVPGLSAQKSLGSEERGPFFPVPWPGGEGQRGGHWGCEPPVLGAAPSQELHTALPGVPTALLM